LEDTQLEFGGAAIDALEERTKRRVCQTCGSRFSGDARFCPFDGEPLVDDDSVVPSSDPLMGAVIDQRYRVLRVLGEGGMGIVYEVEHVTLQRHFALKALRRDLGRMEDLSARFIQEAKAAAAVTHPNIVQIADFGHLPMGEAYFVMELLDGVPLSNVLREYGRIPPQRTIPVVRQVGEALGAAHAVGVIHRDLKPDNIQVCESVGGRQVVKVLDFGLAKVAGASKLTRAGVVFGTPHYMSPEQAAGDPLDHRSDIYSLGVVMYEMLSGRVPFESDTFMGVLTKHMYALPKPLSEVMETSVDMGGLDDIVLRCLQKKPEGRFATMGDLLNALDRSTGRVVSDAHGGVVGASAVAAPRAGEALNSEELAAVGESGSAAAPRALAIGVGVLGFVAAAGLGWWVLPTSDAPDRPPAAVPSVAADTSLGSALSSSVVSSAAPAEAGSSSQQQTPQAGSTSEADAGAPIPVRATVHKKVRRTRKSSTRAAPKPPPPEKPAAKIGGGDIVNPWEN
jgi:hypothetical protein